MEPEITEGIVTLTPDGELVIRNPEFDASFSMILPDPGTRVRVTVETLATP